MGTPQKITRTNGSTAWSATYDSFGNCQINTENITNNLRGAGQYFDAETGLYYNLNRYYDPTIGRYLRIDPFGQGLNLYAYCFNNPHSWIDPLGLCAYNKVSGWVHGGLAALGLIPGIGIVPDLIDAGLYLLEGNLLDAGVAGAAAIPVIGLFTRGGEYLYKVGKWLVKSEKVGDLLKSGWKVVKNNIDALGGALKKGPYSHLADHPSVGPGKDFTQSAKKKILAENRKRNKGVLRDDVTSELGVQPKQHKKRITPPDNEVHVDHIDAKSKGGSNSFSNAAVRLRKHNLAKGNR